MTTAIQSALSGLITASQRLEQTAGDIARGGSSYAAAPAPVAGNGAKTNGVSADYTAVPQGIEAAANPAAPSLTDSLFAAKQAEIQYKASAKLLGALAETQRETLDIVS